MLRRLSFLKRWISALVGAVAAMSGFSSVHATVFGPDDRRAIEDLSAQERRRFNPDPIGLLVTTNNLGGQGICTAAVIAPRLILTASYCADPTSITSASRAKISGSVGRALIHAQLNLGLSGSGVEEVYPVNVTPVEISSKLGYAVMAVEGDPSEKFGMVSLSLRSPKAKEKLFIIQMAPGVASGLTLAENCEIQSSEGQDGYLAHDCDTTPGAGGALIFSRADKSVMGLHSLSAEPPEHPFNRGVSMQDLWLASELIRENSFARFEVSEPPASPTAPPVPAEKGFTLALASDFPAAIKPNSVVLLNGHEHVVFSLAQREVTFLGDDTSLASGLNLLALKEEFASETESWKFWNENHVLKAFEEPYKTSYAVLVAIDDYDRNKDPQHRGKTGYQNLSGMVAHAELLKGALVKTGFPDANILTLYDERATRDGIANLLQEFWHGGKYADADRLFFYFGGHGDELASSGFLVTYDIDSKRPTVTGFLMSDFVDRNFQNIKPLHVLVALDACASGLSIPGTLAGETEDKLKTFRALSIIRNDIEEKGRLLLVAGTDDQKALWENGGLFTQTLIKGLEGEGDMNKDGLIQFEELGLYVSNTVSSEAAQLRVRQQPRQFQATHFGRGKMLFLLPRTK